MKAGKNMTLISRSDVDHLLGDLREEHHNTLGNLYYISGLPDLDMKLKGKFLPSQFKLKKEGIIPNPLNNMTHISKRERGLEIHVTYKYKGYSAGIFLQDVIEIALEEKEQIFGKKEASIIGKAKARGLEFGPGGIVVDSMTGLKGKMGIADMPELTLSIRYGNESRQEGMFVFTGKFRDEDSINAFFQQLLPDAYIAHQKNPNRQQEY